MNHVFRTYIPRYAHMFKWTSKEPKNLQKYTK